MHICGSIFEGRGGKAVLQTCISSRLVSCACHMIYVQSGLLGWVKGGHSKYTALFPHHGGCGWHGNCCINPVSLSGPGDNSLPRFQH